MSRVLPAAALRKGDRVKLPETGAHALIYAVHNADPVPGRIRWSTDEGEVVVGAATRVEVLHLA